MKKFDKILIASDIDGTVLWDSKYIHPNVFEKLRYFCENGGHFALSTGRSHKDVFVIAKDLKEYVNMPCILCNGSYLYDHMTDEILNPQYLDPLPLTEAFLYVKRKFDDVGMRAGTPQGFLCPAEDGVALTVDGAETLGFASANASDTVQSIEFTGSGKVTSITGSYEDVPVPEGFAEDDTFGDVTLTAAQAAWLNGQANYDALAAKIATMTATALYLSRIQRGRRM